MLTRKVVPRIFREEVQYIGKLVSRLNIAKATPARLPWQRTDLRQAESSVIV